MRIIGIEIEEECSAEIRKNLQSGWYPFGNYTIPSEDNHFLWHNSTASDYGLYQLFDNLPKISISCVLGKNGSGKTTLFDVYYKILNNFAYSVLNSSNDVYDSAYLTYVNSIVAKVYYEIDGIIYVIDVNNDVVKLRKQGHNNKWEEVQFLDNIENKLSEFFYTIGLNYSIYSMSFREETNFSDEVYKDSNWRYNIYRNEEGYYVPLTFSPYRTDGHIDIEKEKEIVNERLMTLALINYSKEKMLGGYMLYEIHYELKKNYSKNALNSLNSPGLPFNLDAVLVDEFKKKWSTSRDLKDLIIQGSHKYVNLKDDILTYLSVESLRLCYSYKSYGDAFGLNEIKQLEEQRDSRTRLDDYLKLGNFQKVVDKINGSNSELTAFYRQLLTFLKMQLYSAESGEISAKAIIDKAGCSISYSTIYNLLPPNIYKSRLVFQKKGKLIPMDGLSSGEKQLFYSHIAVLFHINRLSNVENDSRIVQYKHINVIIDEVELYSHPEFQRTYIYSLIDYITPMVPSVALLWYRRFARMDFSYHSVGTAGFNS